MKLGFSLFLGFILSQSLQAAVDTSEVIRLANKVKASAYDTEASAPDVKKAEELLEEVVAILSNDESGDNSLSEFSVCFEYVNAKYYNGYNKADAANKATAVCKSKPELEIVKFLFEKQYNGYNSAAAIDSAAKGATKKLRGKLDIVKFIFEKVYNGYNAADAANKAATLAVSVSKKGGLACIKQLFQANFNGYNAGDAIEQSVTSCSVN